MHWGLCAQTVRLVNLWTSCYLSRKSIQLYFDHWSKPECLRKRHRRMSWLRLTHTVCNGLFCWKKDQGLRLHRIPGFAAHFCSHHWQISLRTTTRYLRSPRSVVLVNVLSRTASWRKRLHQIHWQIMTFWRNRFDVKCSLGQSIPTCSWTETKR